MPTDLCILIRHPPYGSISAAEGIRHLAGALGYDLATIVVLVDDGVWVAKAGQEAGHSGWTSLSEALAGALRPTAGGPPVILAEVGALARGGLSAQDLVPGVIPAGPEAIARAVAQARHVMLF